MISFPKRAKFSTENQVWRDIAAVDIVSDATHKSKGSIAVSVQNKPAQSQTVI
jgi:hypothetical protein